MRNPPNWKATRRMLDREIFLPVAAKHDIPLRSKLMPTDDMFGIGSMDANDISDGLDADLMDFGDDDVWED